MRPKIATAIQPSPPPSPEIQEEATSGSSLETATLEASSYSSDETYSEAIVDLGTISPTVSLVPSPKPSVEPTAATVPAPTPTTTTDGGGGDSGGGGGGGDNLGAIAGGGAGGALLLIGLAVVIYLKVRQQICKVSICERLRS